MGGKGSGRKPNPENVLRRNYEEIASTSTEIFIPNLSGVQHEIKSGTHGITTDDLNEGSTNLYYTDARVKGVDFGTGGSILFLDSDGNITEDNSNLFWDNTNKKLGVGLSSPTAKIDIQNTTKQLRLRYDSDSYIDFETNQYAGITMKGDGQYSTIFRVSAGSASASSGFYLTNNYTNPTSSVASATGMLAYDDAKSAIHFFVGDGAGNQIIITNIVNRTFNHDHATQTNPTLYIHSDTNPNTDNTQWISISHDQTNGVIGLGKGDYTFPNGGIAINTTSATAKLDINSDKMRLRNAKTPSSASDTGNTGDICWDSNYIYICTATNTWKRAAIASW